jgi:lysophospholipase L1-like esterase
MHMNGDAAADQALSAIDKAVKKHGMHDHRPVFVHATWLRPDQIERMKACGAIPSFLTAGIIPGGDAVVRLWGPERSSGAMASRTFLRAGLPFTYSHDAPVSPVPSILALVDAGVNRLSGTGRVVGPDERISPYDALRAVTATAAYQLKEEKTKGTLEPGKLADLVILDRNPLAGDPLTIKDITVLETIKEGLTVYRADGSRPAVECTRRGGLPHFFAKAKAGGEVRVAYLGGSITAAPGWRVGSLEWLKRRFPAASFRELNAAIGGTGSDLGAFRVGQDVIAGKPDLVFVEFAVNDGGTAPEQIQATMEGIVRQVKRADPATDICFVYTLSSPVLADLQAGRCQRSAAAMETVADHYRIPSVHFGPEVAKRIAAGTLIFKGEKSEPFDAAALPMLFSTDGVHPLVETGHVLYTDVLARSLEAIERDGPAAEPQAVPEPLRPDHWEAARLVPITPEMLRGDWQRCEPDADPLARQFSKRMPALWKTATPGASLAFRVTVPDAAGVKARRLAVYDLLGPDGGTVAVRVDGGDPRKLPRIDGYCTYWRLATLALGDLPPGEHEIEVTLTDEKPDKRAILFEHNRPDLEKNPAKYAADTWHVGGLLVFGEVTPVGP